MALVCFTDTPAEPCVQPPDNREVCITLPVPAALAIATWLLNNTDPNLVAAYGGNPQDILDLYEALAGLDESVTCV